MRVNGEALRVIRERSGLTGTALAKEVGIDRTHLSNIENGRKQPAAATAIRMADALRIPLVAILASPEEQSGE